MIIYLDSLFCKWIFRKKTWIFRKRKIRGLFLICGTGVAREFVPFAVSVRRWRKSRMMTEERTECKYFRETHIFRDLADVHFREFEKTCRDHGPFPIDQLFCTDPAFPVKQFRKMSGRIMTGSGEFVNGERTAMPLLKQISDRSQDR